MTRVLSRLEPPLSLLCALYLAALLGVSATAVAPPFDDAYGWWALPGFLLNGLPQLFVAALPIGLLGLSVRRVSLVLGAVVTASVALWLFAPYFVSPNASSSAGASADLSIMTFNVLEDLEALQRAVEAYNTDLVLVQESPSLAELRELDAAQRYPYLAHNGEVKGNAVFSRYPVLAESNVSLGSGWSAQRLLLEVDGHTLAVYNIHLLLPLNLRPAESTLAHLLTARYDERVRNVQIRTLLSELERETHPYIVAGDFNLSEYSPVYRELAAVMGDSYREVGRGFGSSWPSVLPLARIDYIWFSPALVAVKSVRGQRFASDHLPVVSTFAWAR